MERSPGTLDPGTAADRKPPAWERQGAAALRCGHGNRLAKWGGFYQRPCAWQTPPNRTHGIREGMAIEQQLDAAGSPRKGCVIFLLLAVLTLSSPSFAKDQSSDQASLAAAQDAFDAGQWEKVISLARGPVEQSPELDFLAGLALARLQKWPDAKLAFEAGMRKAPADPRFLIELAGGAYQTKGFSNGEELLTCRVAFKSTRRVFPRISCHDLSPRREPGSCAEVLESRGETAASERCVCTATATKGIVAQPRSCFQCSPNSDRRFPSYDGIAAGQSRSFFESPGRTHPG